MCIDIIDKAYKKLDIFVKENSKMEIEGNEFLKSFHEEIEKWNENEDISFINKFIKDNKEIEKVSAIGQAKGNRKNFEIFMEDDKTKQIIKQLFILRKSSKEINYTLVNKIKNIGLIEHLKAYLFGEGKKPELYVNWLLIMIFSEIFTSVANSSDLKKLCVILGKDKNIPFENMQFQIRELIDDYLKKIDCIDKRSLWFKMVMAWDILKI